MQRSVSRGVAAAMLATFTMVSCVRMPAGVTSSTLPITAYDEYTVEGPAVGWDSAFGILSLAVWPYSAHDAIKHAKQRHNVDGMIDVTAENQVVWLTLILPLFTWHTIKVRGEGVKFTKGGPNS